MFPSWLIVPESWQAPVKEATDEPPRPKKSREPAVWRPMTDLERQAAIELGRCRLPPATSTKRMARHMAAQAQRDEPEITDKQAEYMWKFCWTYRRQIGNAEVRKEAKRRRKES